VPLIEINASPTTLGARTPSEVLRAVNAAVAQALSAAPDAAWSIWRELDDDGYVIGAAHEPRHAGPLPPVVHVYARRTPEEWALIVDAIERVLRELLDLDDAAVLVTTQPFRA
jgi:hypothetical protein